MRRWRVLGLLGAAATAAAASVALVVVLGDDDQGTVDGPVIAHRPWEEYPAAEVTGVLELDGDCLTIDGTLVVWDDGATWDDESQAVRLDGATFAVGEDVEGGGGYDEGPGLLYDAGRFGEVATDALRSCVDSTGADTVVSFHR